MSGTDLSYKAILGKVLVPLKVQHPLPTIARRCISWAGGTHRGKKRIRIWNKIFFGGNGDGLNLVIVLKGRKFFRVRLRRVLGPSLGPGLRLRDCCRCRRKTWPWCTCLRRGRRVLSVSEAAFPRCEVGWHEGMFPAPFSVFSNSFCKLRYLSPIFWTN